MIADDTPSALRWGRPNTSGPWVRVTHPPADARTDRSYRMAHDALREPGQWFEALSVPKAWGEALRAYAQRHHHPIEISSRGPGGSTTCDLYWRAWPAEGEPTQ